MIFNIIMIIFCFIMMCLLKNITENQKTIFNEIKELKMILISKDKK